MQAVVDGKVIAHVADGQFYMLAEKEGEFKLDWVKHSTISFLNIQTGFMKADHTGIYFRGVPSIQEEEKINLERFSSLNCSHFISFFIRYLFEGQRDFDLKATGYFFNNHIFAIRTSFSGHPETLLTSFQERYPFYVFNDKIGLLLNPNNLDEALSIYEERGETFLISNFTTKSTEICIDNFWIHSLHGGTFSQPVQEIALLGEDHQIIHLTDGKRTLKKIWEERFPTKNYMVKINGNFYSKFGQPMERKHLKLNISKQRPLLISPQSGELIFLADLTSIQSNFPNLLFSFHSPTFLPPTFPAPPKFSSRPSSNNTPHTTKQIQASCPYTLSSNK
jgi:hypothetical protein